MYKVIGIDGKEYGPISLDQLKQWVSENRINSQTRVLDTSTGEWKTAGQLLELSEILPAASPQPQFAAAAPVASAQTSQGLAITSLVLGIASFALCLTFLTGIPAIICGHIAHSRARRFPQQYGGAGLAIAGLSLGYCSLLLLPLFAAMFLPAFARAKSRAETISCVNNMKQVGLAFKIWEMEHNNQFPFNVPARNGGTLESCSLGADGYDQNSVAHFQVLSNELSNPKILVCPADKSKQPAANFKNLQNINVTYQVRSGAQVTSRNAQQVLAICPVHGTILYVDGSVQQMRSPARSTLR